MSASDTGVDRIVAYGRERYWINRVPLALLACIGGLFMIALDPGPPGLLPLVLIVALSVMGAVYGLASVALDHAMDTSKRIWSLGLVLTLVLVVAVFVLGPHRYQRTTFVDPGFRTLGWMFVIFSFGFIGFALMKHLRPDRPMMMLSPAGVHMNISWLKNLVIPWTEVEDFGPLEHHHPGGIVMRHPETLAIAFSRDYYEREIQPRRSFLSGRLWRAMFQERGAQMQMLLPYSWFSIAKKDMQEPVEARWKAFREIDAGMPPPAAGPLLHISAWSPGLLTRWQIALFAVPMAGVLFMLAHFAGAWDTAFLKTAREDFAKLRAAKEEVRDARRKGEFVIKSGPR